VTAAEKYAELEAAGLERPVCECHGEPKMWSSHPRKPCGGGWRCSVQQRDRNAIYRAANREELNLRKRASTAVRRVELREKYADYYTRNLEAQRARIRENNRRRRGWYDEGGMATEPLRVKELT
jgi:hypothetical protein